ncbi:hypothetical protein POM88_001511 [Heracleum sosnowskyi]|uniref:Uncharacterized protein n=1 Tax=Heracleum sosnowskyi TaxID=360622 RepID=A0AAD8JFZ6_9APIA|nr:hypothetical protein POM88_001511 [Heracleum sosnowskyi]
MKELALCGFGKKKERDVFAENIKGQFIFKAVFKQFGAGGYGGSDFATDGAEFQQHQKLEKLYISTRASKGGFAMRQYVSELMPLIVEALLDGPAATKREVGVATLGQLVHSTGYISVLMFGVTNHFIIAAKKREMRYSDLKKIDRGVGRHFHDDITVIVLFLDSNLVSKASTTKGQNLSIKGSGISLPSIILAPSA